MTNSLAVFGNNLFVVSALIGVFYAIVWRTQNKTDKKTRRILDAWLVMLVAIIIRIGYWPLASLLSPPELEFHPLMWKNKGWVAALAGIIFSVGMVRYIHLIRPFKVENIFLLFIIAILLSIFFSH